MVASGWQDFASVASLLYSREATLSPSPTHMLLSMLGVCVGIRVTLIDAEEFDFEL